jgi:hypothetical protein
LLTEIDVGTRSSIEDKVTCLHHYQEVRKLFSKQIDLVKILKENLGNFWKLTYGILEYAYFGHCIWFFLGDEYPIININWILLLFYENNCHNNYSWKIFLTLLISSIINIIHYFTLIQTTFFIIPISINLPKT